MQREVEQLRRENDSLRTQNDSMRAGMRRCVTCEYRIDFKERQGQAPVAAGGSDPDPIEPASTDS